MSTQNTERITSVMLNDKNFNMWAKQATLGLVGRDRFEFVNGDIIMPVPVPSYWLAISDNEASCCLNHDISRDNSGHMGKDREDI
jgi:gag-polypeptide of LTR copia-type